MHEEEPGKEKELAGQGEQVDDPFSAAYVFPPQGKHTDSDSIADVDIF